MVFPSSSHRIVCLPGKVIPWHLLALLSLPALFALNISTLYEWVANLAALNLGC